MSRFNPHRLLSKRPDFSPAPLHPTQNAHALGVRLSRLDTVIQRVKKPVHRGMHVDVHTALGIGGIQDVAARSLDDVVNIALVVLDGLSVELDGRKKLVQPVVGVQVVGCGGG